jgi:hypothetical protein
LRSRRSAPCGCQERPPRRKAGTRASPHRAAGPTRPAASQAVPPGCSSPACSWHALLVTRPGTTAGGAYPVISRVSGAAPACRKRPGDLRK